MLKILKKIWIPFFLLASFIFIGQYFYNQADRLNDTFHLAPRFLLIASAFQLNYWFLAVRNWQRIVSLSTCCKIGFIQGFSHFALISLGKYVPGKIWGMVARISLMKQQGITLHQSMHASLNEQFLLLHASALLSAILLCVITPSIFTAVLCVLAVGTVMMTVPLQRIAFKLLAHLAKKSQRYELQETIPLTLRQSAGLLVGYGMLWLTIGLIFSCIYFSLFRVDPTLLIIMQLVLANTVGMTLGFLAVFSPGGLGVREAVTCALLASLLPLGDALLLTLVFRLWLVISEVLSGVALLVPHKAGAGGR